MRSGNNLPIIFGGRAVLYGNIYDKRGIQIQLTIIYRRNENTIFLCFADRASQYNLSN